MVSRMQYYCDTCAYESFESIDFNKLSIRDFKDVDLCDNCFNTLSLKQTYEKLKRLKDD